MRSVAKQIKYDSIENILKEMRRLIDKRDPRATRVRLEVWMPVHHMMQPARSAIELALESRP